jgi:hypothetical protein
MTQVGFEPWRRHNRPQTTWPQWSAATFVFLNKHLYLRNRNLSETNSGLTRRVLSSGLKRRVLGWKPRDVSEKHVFDPEDVCSSETSETSCTRMETNRRFGETCLRSWGCLFLRNIGNVVYSDGNQQTFRRNMSSFLRMFVPPKHRSIFNVLDDVISKKTELFISTALRSWDPSQAVCDFVVSSFCWMWLGRRM